MHLPPYLPGLHLAAEPVWRLTGSVIGWPLPLAGPELLAAELEVRGLELELLPALPVQGEQEQSEGELRCEILLRLAPFQLCGPPPPWLSRPS